MRTTLEILDQIHSYPGHTMPMDDLYAFIGHDGRRVASDLSAKRLIRTNALTCMVDPLAVFSCSVDVAGMEMLAAHRSLLDDQHHQQAEANRKQRLNDIQRIRDRKRQYRHDFKVAAFTVAFTLLLEHFTDILNFIKNLL